MCFFLFFSFFRNVRRQSWDDDSLPLWFLVLHDWLTHTSTHPAPQVATRFLSVCPALYWGVVSEGRLLGPEVQRWICIYAITFGLLGALMFPTFYPWT